MRKIKDNQIENVDEKERKISIKEYNLDVYKDRIKEIRKKSLDFPVGYTKRFEVISTEEKNIFEFLLDEEKYKLLHSKRYDIPHIKICRELIELLYAVVDKPEWELDTYKIEHLEMKFLFPGIQELLEMYKFLNSQEEIGESRLKIINVIQRKINQLYKDLESDIYKEAENPELIFEEGDCDDEERVDEDLNKILRYVEYIKEE